MSEKKRFPWEFHGEKVSFDTPEQTHIEFEVAPFGSRFAAWVIDRIVIGMILAVIIGCIILFSLGLSIIPSLREKETFGYIVAAGIVMHFLVSLLYYTWGEVCHEGQTRGKKWLKVRTIMISGQGVTLGGALIRNLARVVDDIPIFWLIPAFTHGHRRLGDFLASTAVINTASEIDGVRPVKWISNSHRELEDRQYYFSPDVAARLYPDDLNLLEHLKARLRGTQHVQRQTTLEEIARRYIERLDLQEDEERALADPERFLEELGLFLKERFDSQAY